MSTQLHEVVGDRFLFTRGNRKGEIHEVVEVRRKYMVAKIANGKHEEETSERGFLLWCVREGAAKKIESQTKKNR